MPSTVTYTHTSAAGATSEVTVLPDGSGGFDLYCDSCEWQTRLGYRPTTHRVGTGHLRLAHA